MKIGIFDSGLGGLIIAKAIIKKLPKYDYVYLGDTGHLPYGNKSQTQIYAYAKKAVNALVRRNCSLIIIACNTVSAKALRKLQNEYLPRNYPGIKILGVIVPTLETIAKYGSIGLLATESAVKSGKYQAEFKKLNKNGKLYASSAASLVPLIESNKLALAEKSLKGYISRLLSQNVKAIALGCTHFALLKNAVRKQAGSKIKVISQDEILPDKTASYLRKHQEITKNLSRRGTREFFVTSESKHFNAVAQTLFGKHLKFKLVHF